MKTKNAKLWLLLSAILTFSTCNAYDFCSDGIYYEILSETDRTVAVTYRYENSNSYSGEITIPKKLIYSGKTYTVTSIGAQAFYNCSRLTAVTIPGSVTSIGAQAFYNCSRLTAVTIPDSVSSIGNYVFSGCNSLTDVYISDLKAWCNITFTNSTSNPLCHADNLYLNGELITDLVIPNSVSVIKDYAFYNSKSITSITIPESVITIKLLAFYISSLSKIDVDVNNNVYCSIDGALYSKNKSKIILCPQNYYKSSFILPDMVTSIGDYAFCACSGLTSVTIPESVTEIGEFAFYYCSGLTSVTIPESVTEIGDFAFSGCSGVTSVTIPESVTSIPYGTFYNCNSLTAVTIPDSVTSIGVQAFEGCQRLANVTIGNSVTSIGVQAFSDWRSLKNIYCTPDTPPTYNSNFSDDNYKNATLYVPIGKLSLYEKVDPWRNFWNIEEYDFSGVEDVKIDESVNVEIQNGDIILSGISDTVPIEIFDISGKTVYKGYDRTIHNLSKGIYILKANNFIKKVQL